MVSADLYRPGAPALMEVVAPARLHLGLINESGYLDRVDGGLGVQVQSPRWRYFLSPADHCDVSGDIVAELKQAALTVLQMSCSEFNLEGVRLEIAETVPLHVGLGAKTSLLASMVRALSLWTDKDVSLDQVAGLSGRGGASGVGINAIHTGGFIIDVGRQFGKEKASYLPSSQHHDRAPRALPAFELQGYSIVHFRFDESGIAGADEADFFAKSCPVPLDETKELLLQLYGRLLPALLEDNDAEFQASLRAMQTLGLKRREWGLQSGATHGIRSHLESSGIQEALCLSSVGPTVAVITKRPYEVKEVVARFEVQPLHLELTCVSQQGMLTTSLPQRSNPVGFLNSVRRRACSE